MSGLPRGPVTTHRAKRQRVTIRSMCLRLADRPIVGDAERGVPDHVARAALAYGEVRVGPGLLWIGVESLCHVSTTVRSIFERAVAAAGVDPDDVLVVRVTEGAIEVDAIDPDDLDWPVRTRLLTSGQLGERTGVGPDLVIASSSGVGPTARLQTGWLRAS
jgi:hypothetical protein